MNTPSSREAGRIVEPVLQVAHRLLAAALTPGSVAIDATVGNGHDTLHLARCVGAEGHVIGYDVQAEAVRRTRQRLADAGCLDRVTLLHTGHETLAESVPAALAGRGSAACPSAVCFNLGYLPGGDKSRITRPETTLAALHGALTLLLPGAILTTVLYSGHPGGTEERDAVLHWAQQLPSTAYHVLHYRFINQPHAPELVAVEVRAR